MRCALAWNEETARLARQHNDANIVAVGGRTTAPETITEIVHAFLTSEFAGGRHAQRIGFAVADAGKRIRVPGRALVGQGKKFSREG